MLPRLPDQTHCLCISIACEATSIFDGLGYRLCGTHLVEHRTLDITLDTHKTVVGTDDNDIILVKTYVASQSTIQNVFVDINHRNQLSTPIDFNVTKSTNIIDATSHVERMEYCGKSTQSISAWSHHLAHDIDHDGARLPHSNL